MSRRSLTIWKAADEPPTFADAMFSRQARRMMEELFSYQGALGEAIDGIVRSDAPDKEKLVRAAIAQFITAIGPALRAALQTSVDIEKGTRNLSMQRVQQLRRVCDQLNQMLGLPPEAANEPSRSRNDHR